MVITTWWGWVIAAGGGLAVVALAWLLLYIIHLLAGIWRNS